MSNDRHLRFRELHRSGCFVIANPWNAGTAAFLEQAGFQALATSSAGVAFDRGLKDAPDALSLDLVLSNIREIVDATSLPVNADFQAGYADGARGVEDNVRRCIETGVSGLSIEDASGDQEKPLFELSDAVERIQAARAAIDSAGGDVILTGRAECFLVGQADLDETVTRLVAYSEAGADCLYAPGLQTAEQVKVVVEAVGPKPVNLLIGRAGGFSVAEAAELGVRRVSVGSAFARVAWAAFMRASRQIIAEGSFDGFDDAASFDELNALFGDR